MNHSLNFGNCELAPVIAKDAATLICNSISKQEDVEQVLDNVSRFVGNQGIQVVKNSNVGLWSKLPQIVRK